MTIHVSNISLNIIDADLRRLFSAYGEVNAVMIDRDKLNGRSRGTAQIDMVNDSQAKQAILCLNHMVVDGKPISVKEVSNNISDYMN